MLDWSRHLHHLHVLNGGSACTWWFGSSTHVVEFYKSFKIAVLNLFCLIFKAILWPLNNSSRGIMKWICKRKGKRWTGPSSHCCWRPRWTWAAVKGECCLAGVATAAVVFWTTDMDSGLILTHIVYQPWTVILMTGRLRSRMSAARAKRLAINRATLKQKKFLGLFQTVNHLELWTWRNISGHLNIRGILPKTLFFFFALWKTSRELVLE